MTELVTELVRIAAFSEGSRGGNPAGVWVGAQLPAAEEMQRIAAEVGFSETAFAAPLHSEGQGAEVRQWRVRYFSPEAEVPFCGPCHHSPRGGAGAPLRGRGPCLAPQPDPDSGLGLAG